MNRYTEVISCARLCIAIGFATLTLSPGLSYGASAELPIKARIIGFTDVVRACEVNDRHSIGWENEFTFEQSCANIRARNPEPEPLEMHTESAVPEVIIADGFRILNVE